MLNTEIKGWLENLSEIMKETEIKDGIKLSRLNLNSFLPIEEDDVLMKSLKIVHPTGEFRTISDDDYSHVHAVVYTEWHFPYNALEENWNDKIAHLSFRLPRNANELRSAADTLQSALYYWRDKAARNECKLVLIEKNGHVKYALEILYKEDVPTINLAKGVYNRLPDSKDAKIIKRWADQFGIDYSHCQDLK